MLNLQKAAEHKTETLITIFNNAFEGYIGGSFELTLESFQHFCSNQGVNLVISQVILNHEQPVGLALIARRGWTSRLVAMAISKEAQNQKVGTSFMQELISQAQARADRYYELEVIEQNPAAVKLYEKVGFKKLTRLVEGSLENPITQQQGTLEPVDIVSAASFIAKHNDATLPWQLSAYNLVQLAEPNKAFRFNDAVVVLSDPSEDEVRIHNLTVAKHKRRQGQATRLVQLLFASHPHKKWRFPALCPEDCFPFFEKQGFEKGKLSQFHMQLVLD